MPTHAPQNGTPAGHPISIAHMAKRGRVVVESRPSLRSGRADQRLADRLEEIRRARDASTPVSGRLINHIQGLGAHVDLGDGAFGWADEADLPLLLRGAVSRPSSPGGSRIDCLIRRVGPGEGGRILVSPRRAGLARLRRAGPSRIIEGIVHFADSAGVIVDFDGARGFASRTEMPLKWVSDPPQPGASWRGYVLRYSADTALLSYFEPSVRQQRDARRAIDVAAFALDRVHRGQVIHMDDVRALVAFERGLLFGVAPPGKPVAPKARPLRVGASRFFRVVSQFVRPGQEQSGIDLWLAAVPAPRALMRPHAPKVPSGVAIPRLPNSCPIWARERWKRLPEYTRLIVAWSHGISTPRRTNREIGDFFGFSTGYAWQVSRESDWELISAAGPGTAWLPSKQEDRHRFVMNLLGLGNC